MAEYSIVALIFTMLVVGVIEFALVAQAGTAVQQASRSKARDLSPQR